MLLVSSVQLEQEITFSILKFNAMYVRVRPFILYILVALFYLVTLLVMIGLILNNHFSMLTNLGSISLYVL